MSADWAEGFDAGYRDGHAKGVRAGRAAAEAEREERETVAFGHGYIKGRQACIAELLAEYERIVASDEFGLGGGWWDAADLLGRSPEVDQLAPADETMNPGAHSV